MAKPWADIVQQQSGNEYLEEVVSDVGEHMRTRPAPGFTPPGGGRPTGNSVDDTPVPYHQLPHDKEFGIRDNEELYVPPPPTRPEDGKAPTQPQEFEAVWMDRYLKRTQSQGEPQIKKLILPTSYNSATPDDSDIAAMQQQMRLMQAAIERKLAEKAEEAERAKKATLPTSGHYIDIRVPMAGGTPAAMMFAPGKDGVPFDVAAALSLAQVLIR